MKHKHQWENVLDQVSTDSAQDMQISMCRDCMSVKVYYKDIRKTVVVNKPSSKKTGAE